MDAAAQQRPEEFRLGRARLSESQEVSSLHSAVINLGAQNGQALYAVLFLNRALRQQASIPTDPPNRGPARKSVRN